MKRYTWLIVPALIVFYCCNPLKKVMDSQDKTKKVVDNWLAKNPIKADTSFKFLPGDTSTTLLVAYDTAYVKDTVEKTVIQTVTKTKTITNTIHDTVKVTIDNGLLGECQKALQQSNQAQDSQKLEVERQKLRADKWLLYFIIESIIFGVCIAISIYLKLKP